jgi:hypothetical protein
LDDAVALHVLLRVADWLWHAASIAAPTPGYDIFALPLAYDIIALRPHRNKSALTAPHQSHTMRPCVRRANRLM